MPNFVMTQYERLIHVTYGNHYYNNNNTSIFYLCLLHQVIDI